MTQAQLPPRFQSHPEIAAGIITLDQAVMMIRNGWLTHDGARYLLPLSAWSLLPKPQLAQARRLRRGGWMEGLKLRRKSS